MVFREMVGEFGEGPMGFTLTRDTRGLAYISKVKENNM